jgi:flagellin-like hook-associated protein FlgL
MSWMNTTDSTMSQMSSVIQSLQQLVSEGVNTTSQNPAQLTALSETSSQYINQLYQMMNTQQGSQYIFGGTSSVTPPFPYAGAVNEPAAGVGAGGSVAIASSIAVASGSAIDPGRYSLQMAGSVSAGTSTTAGTFQNVAFELLDGTAVVASGTAALNASGPGFSGSGSASGINVLFGIGVNYQVTRQIGVRAEYRNTGVSSITGVSSGGLSSFLLGATYQF